MILNSDGIAVRDENAKFEWLVQMKRPRARMAVVIPADDEREAMAVAENENPRYVAYSAIPTHRRNPGNPHA